VSQPSAPRFRFSPKLRLAPLWPALLALATFTGLALALLPGTIAEETARDLLATSRLLAPVLRVPAGAPYDALQQQVSQLAANGPYRLTVIRLDGVVIADSGVAPERVAQLENHRDRPEIQQALRHGEGYAVRHSATIGEEMAYAARLVGDPDGHPWLLRLAKPLASLTTLRHHLARGVLLAAVVALLALAGLSWWFSRSLFRPLSSLVAAAQELGGGNYQTPIPVPNERELAALGRALVRLPQNAEGQLAAVRAERDLLQHVLTTLREGVLVADRQGRVVTANPAFAELFRAGEIPAGIAATERVRQPDFGDVLAQGLAGQSVAPHHVELYDPARRVLELSALPLAAGDGAVVVARDLTAAERLHQMRRDFFANVSHELKTPLSAIRGCAETLRDGAMEEPEQAAHFLDRLLAHCQRLEQLVTDVLTLSRLESPDRTVELEEVDLGDVAREAAERLASAASAQQVQIAVAAGPPATCCGERDGLERLVTNLLENAMKYNRPGGTVTVAASAGAAEVTIEVRDTGIGIPSDALPRIFERFFRVDRGRGRNEGGTGLGLAIVKHVVQAHGGRIEVESTPGRGSAFRVTLPRAALPR